MEDGKLQPLPPDIQAAWAEVPAKIAKIREKREEQDKLFQTLLLYAAVAAQGINPKDVDRFTFDKDALTAEDKKFILKAINLDARVVSSGGLVAIWRRASGKYHNVVTLKDGNRITLSPPVLRGGRETEVKDDQGTRKNDSAG
jgi:hypothetical protein